MLLKLLRLVVDVLVQKDVSRGGGEPNANPTVHAASSPHSLDSRTLPTLQQLALVIGAVIARKPEPTPACSRPRIRAPCRVASDCPRARMPVTISVVPFGTTAGRTTASLPSSLSPTSSLLPPAHPCLGQHLLAAPPVAPASAPSGETGRDATSLLNLLYHGAGCGWVAPLIQVGHPTSLCTSLQSYPSTTRTDIEPLRCPSSQPSTSLSPTAGLWV